VGKTTTAVSLASCLAAAEKKTLLIDIDPQGNATTGLGLDKRKISSTIYDLMIGREDPTEIVCGTELSSLDLIPSNHDLAGAEVELVGMMSRETRLKSALKSISDKYEYIIMDCPPSLGLLTLNAMTAADSLIIPVQCEYYAMEGMADLYHTIKLVKSHLNTTLRVRGIVLTMYDSRNNLSRQVASEIRKYFKEEVFQVVIPRNVKLSEAPSYGKPILLYDVSSRGAKSYFALAAEVIAMDKPKTEENNDVQSQPASVTG
jgi:chromosome partitioning protein